MSKSTIVTFLKSWRGYGVGETAGFEATKAQDLVDAEVAELFKKGRKASNKLESAPNKPSTPPAKAEEKEDLDADPDADPEAKP